MFDKAILKNLGEIHRHNLLRLDTYYTNGLIVDISLDHIEYEYYNRFNDEYPPDQEELKEFLTDLIEEEFNITKEQLELDINRRLEYWRNELCYG